MILDNENVFSSAQAIHTTAVVSSTNVLDLGSTVHDIGTGEDLYFVVTLTTALADTDSNATVLVELCEDADAAFSNTTTAVVVGTFAAVSAAGSQFVYRLSPGSVTERYLKVVYTTSGGPLSAGAADAYLVKDLHKWSAKPNAAGASLPQEG